MEKDNYSLIKNVVERYLIKIAKYCDKAVKMIAGGQASPDQVSRKIEQAIELVGIMAGDPIVTRLDDSNLLLSLVKNNYYSKINLYRNLLNDDTSSLFVAGTQICQIFDQIVELHNFSLLWLQQFTSIIGYDSLCKLMTMVEKEWIEVEEFLPFED